MTHVLSVSPATTSYSSPIAAWSSTLVQASVNASSMSVRQSRVTPRVCIELSSTRRTTGTLSASRGNNSVNLISTTGSLPRQGYPAGSRCLTCRSVREPDGEVLDDGVRQQCPGNLLRRCGRIVRVEVELEVLALPDLGHPVEAETGQRPLDRLTLRVEDLRFEHHVDDDLGHDGSLG